MKTIKLEDFLYGFMTISRNLTKAEMRMLYFLIREPFLIEVPQQDFADKIETHRRTINIGLKKLMQYKYIWDIHIEDRMKNIEPCDTMRKKVTLTEEELKNHKKFIIDSFKYHYNKFLESKSIIVNEDFYSLLLGDMRLNEIVRYNKDFITDTVLEASPKSKIYDMILTSECPSRLHYNIIQFVNKEILKARSFNRYVINRPELLSNLSKSFYISEDECMKIIKLYFPKLYKNRNNLKIPKPWRLRWVDNYM